ncbi:MAG: type IX secretion system sortase PorU [Calditrichaeota bacterium]|nr:type IX secretion system sortase PorU [Calditrichota bacterium]
MVRKHYFDRFFVFRLLVLLGLIFAFNRLVFSGSEALEKSPVKIIASSDHSLTLDYDLLNLQDDSVKIGGRIFHRFFFLDATDGVTTGPDVPVTVLPIGIPPHARVKIQLLKTESISLPDADVVPRLSWKKVDGMYQSYFQLPENYFETRHFVPGVLAEVLDSGFMEDLFIARIRLNPIQYNPAQHLVKITTKMRLRIDFSGGKTTGSFQVEEGSRDVSTYENAVINFDQARKWIFSTRQKSLRKRFRLQDNRTFYKFPVYEDGIYKITGKFLKDNGINLSTIDPKTLKIFNNGGKTLPRGLNVPRPDSLLENAIYVSDGQDGHFDEGDYLLFYGKSVSGWDYDPKDGTRPWKHYINPYTSQNIYWITFNDGIPGKRIQAVSAPPNAALPERTEFAGHIFWEDERYNILHSGMVWLGLNFLGQEEKSLSLLLPDLVPDRHINLMFQMYSPSGGKQHIRLYLNSELISTKAFYAFTLKKVSVPNVAGAKDGGNTLSIKYDGKTPTSQLYLDWVEVEYPRKLALRDGMLFFNTPADGVGYQYTVSGVDESTPWVLDVTDFQNVRLLKDWTLSRQNLRFSLTPPSDRPLRLAVVESRAFKTPGALIKDEPSDLRNPQNGADFLIISHGDFYNVAMGLKNLRETHDNLATTVVKIQDVYDEFSGGLFDPTAIRDFLKYVYFHWEKRPQYVLLYGDGDYDYKNILGHSDENWIPAYEDSSLDEYSTLTSDDWYASVNGNDHLIDYAIGRIPSQTTDQAENVLNKIVDYESNPNFAPWRNQVTIVADDEFGDISKGNVNETIHTRDAEDIAEHYYPALYDKNKIYLTEYPMVLDAAASGRRKPAAENDFVEKINQGCLMINYLGHGNERLLAHERVLQVSKDLPRIQNAGRLAFWITATCAFGRYDLPEEQSMTEQLVTEADNGAIALLSSARDVFASQNASFNKIYLRKLFVKPNKTLRVGKALQLAKIASSNGLNDQKYWLCGDPTLNLAVPTLDVKLEKIYPDSLKALSKILVTGTVLKNGVRQTDFNGRVYLKAFDSKRPVTYTTAVGSSIHYILPGRPIFRGEEDVTNGRFSIRFIVPKDISYGGNLGRISAYIWNADIDGAGYKEGITVDGTAKGLVDNQGPKIQIGFKNQDFLDGDLLGPNPVMEVTLTDEQSGINIAGDIGHKITLTLDNETAAKRDITSYFQYDVGSYLSGKLEYPLPHIPVGTHTAELKAWDNSNNSSTRTIHFTIMPQDQLIVQQLYPYPNPFQDWTTFSFEINRPADITLKIYTLSGRLIQTLPSFAASVGFNTIRWDGHDGDGAPLANGLYLFRFEAHANGQKLEKIGKLIKIN